MKTKLVLMTTSISCASFLLISQAQAQVATTPESTDSGGALTEIVVTAQKRAENLQKVPISIAVLNPDQIRDSGVQNTQDLANALPGLQILNNGGGDTPHIRGVGSGFSDLIKALFAGFPGPRVGGRCHVGCERAAKVRRQFCQCANATHAITKAIAAESSAEVHALFK